jgi:hypothetical protein
VCGDETRLRTLYEEMHEVPGYKSFLKNTNVTVFGTYDGEWFATHLYLSFSL